MSETKDKQREELIEKWKDAGLLDRLLDEDVERIVTVLTTQEKAVMDEMKRERNK